MRASAIGLRNQIIAPIFESKSVFQINRIFCVGRNYAAHALEMGKNPQRDLPFFFTKWPEAYVPSNSTVPYPLNTGNFHFETELVIAIGKGGTNVSVANAIDIVLGYAVGLDMTRRDLQLEAREHGRPWDTGKNFDGAMPLGQIHRIDKTGKLEKGRICLEVNGQFRQDADIRDLIWSVDEIIAYLSKLYFLRPGDLIMTGTPEGVGSVVPGDRLKADIEGLSPLEIEIGNPS